ncbi:MAG: ribosome biogenesis factor YjgA [Steroidobacterales bacterium]
MMPQSELPDTDNGEDLRPSRTARKREAEGQQKLGERLATLKDGELAALGLPDVLLAAIAEVRRIRSRPALARQRQYIGRLMRTLDPALLERARAACAQLARIAR